MPRMSSGDLSRTSLEWLKTTNWDMALSFLYLAFTRIFHLVRLSRRDRDKLAIGNSSCSAGEDDDPSPSSRPTGPATLWYRALLEILKSAATFFGAELDRQQPR